MTLTTSPVSQNDDQAPLLSGDRGINAQKPTPLPKLQIAILMLATLVEPISSHCIYPFINQLVRELDITGGDDKKVGYYAGIIESLFFAAQAVTILQWSRVSDRVGRKPVLLLGIFGLSLSMLCFGLSRTFTGLVLSRCIAGALNGNAGVMKSMLGELTDSTNMAQGFALMPMAWSLGVTIGPAMGGALSRPQDHFPNVFAAPFWTQFPYFLPCAATAAFSVLTFMSTLLYLKEVGNLCIITFKQTLLAVNKTLPRDIPQDKLAPLVDSETPSPETGYGAVNEQHALASSLSNAPVPLRQLLNAPRVLRIANYGVLSTLEIAMYALQPLFYSTPIEHGGLGFTPMTIGFWMAGFGIANGLIQAIYFTPLVVRMGAKNLFRAGHFCFLPIFGLFPVINWVAKGWGINWLVWVLLACQLVSAVIMDMSFACILMYITAAAPNKRSLGAINGLAQTTASVVRAIGPALATSLFAYSIQHNLLGGHAVYAVMILLTIVTAPFGAKLPDDVAASSD
ncbi:hypothetical protein HYDPIDRAFT_126547 [Hydnomerulius pinastri MD-312]|nr:hypothetical protein HYDPIDRAFT_126547 [Hydnomerulius pinastri MD-312]